MAEPGKRVEVRLGSFVCSIEGYDNPVEQMREILGLMQQMINETPQLAEMDPDFESSEVQQALEDRMGSDVEGEVIILRNTASSAARTESASDDVAMPETTGEPPESGDAIAAADDEVDDAVEVVGPADESGSERASEWDVPVDAEQPQSPEAAVAEMMENAAEDTAAPSADDMPPESAPETAGETDAIPAAGQGEPPSFARIAAGVVSVVAKPREAAGEDAEERDAGVAELEPITGDGTAAATGVDEALAQVTAEARAAEDVDIFGDDRRWASEPEQAAEEQHPESSAEPATTETAADEEEDDEAFINIFASEPAAATRAETASTTAGDDPESDTAASGADAEAEEAESRPSGRSRLFGRRQSASSEQAEPADDTVRARVNVEIGTPRWDAEAAIAAPRADAGTFNAFSQPPRTPETEPEARQDEPAQDGQNDQVHHIRTGQQTDAPAAEPRRAPTAEQATVTPMRPLSGATAVDFARQTGSTNVADLLSACAAWLTITGGKPQFTRRDVMEVFDTLPGDHNRTLEARIKGYGKLVRSGALVLISDGVFALSPAEREKFELMLR